MSQVVEKSRLLRQKLNKGGLNKVKYNDQIQIKSKKWLHNIIIWFITIFLEIEFGNFEFPHKVARIVILRIRNSRNWRFSKNKNQ